MEWRAAVRYRPHWLADMAEYNVPKRAEDEGDVIINTLSGMV